MSDATETVTLGGGCFWCLDAAYRLIEGVTEVVSGYAGGDLANPTYDQVCSGRTGHAEVVQVTFDPARLPLEDVLEIFWAVHDPTQLNKQGADVGSQYRSIILHHDEHQERAAMDSLRSAQDLWERPIVTQIVPLQRFYRAEDYHQDYFAQHPEQGYCAAVINPKVSKIREKFASRLRSTV